MRWRPGMAAIASPICSRRIPKSPVTCRPRQSTPRSIPPIISSTSTRFSAGFSANSASRRDAMESSLRSLSGPRIKYTPDDSPYESITVDKLTPIIGGEIGGIDLRTPSNRQMDEIHRALAENLVIFFRDQHLTPKQHLAFGRKFGELHIHPAAPHEGDDPALMKIYADKDSPRVNGEGWHSDVSCDVEPPMGSILHIKQCPPSGGDTLFASMYAAYESLSERMKTYLDGLTALHDGES